MVKIAHTADVHWRGLSRHDEYKEIFTAFIEDCRKNKVDHIYVGGDIFHTKTTGISPEYIEQLTWWLESMSEVAPVHLTLGNHDGNLVNLSRQDAVSPVVKALKNSRIHLYKKSGMYEFEDGFVWCNYSLFDEEGWKDVKPIKNKVNIACYHGPVRGSITETGWGIDEGLSVEFFNEYPFVFLGDIHRAQHLGYRNGKPWISYPGTPIQQNYAEDLDHGYLLWEINNKDDWFVSFKKLPNPKPYVTVTWNGSKDDILKSVSDYPSGARFRVKSSDHLSQKDLQDLSDILKGSRSASEVTFKSEFVANKSIVKTESSTIEKTNLRNPDVLYKLIKDYHKSSQYSEGIWQLVQEQLKNYLTIAITSEESTRNSKWSLRRLEFDNMFTYGNNNVVNFDKLNGIVGIFGPNRIGKSSIVGTLMYSLFNATDRGPMKNIHVCNIRKPYCSSRMVINHNGTDYVIERQTTKSENKKGVVTAATALNLFRINEAGEAEDLAGEQRNDTEKTIRSLIGNQEDFLMTSLSAQGEINQFISQGSTKRRSIMSRFLDLDVIDKMCEFVNKDLNLLKAQLRNFPDRDWSSLIEQINADLSQSDKLIQKINGLIQEEKLRLSNLQFELTKHKDVSPVTEEQVKLFAKKVDSIEKESIYCSQTIDNLNSEIFELNKKLNTIIEVKSENDIDDLKRRREAHRSLENSLMLLQSSYEKELSQLDLYRKTLKILDEVPCGDEYPTCKFIKDAHSNKQKFSEQKLRVESALSKLNDAASALEIIKNENIVEKLNKLEKLIGLESKLTLDHSRKETELANAKSMCSQHAQDLANAKIRLSQLRDALKNEENADVVSIKLEIQQLSESIVKHEEAKFEEATKKGRLIASLEKAKEEKLARDSLLEKMKVHEIVSSALSKKGIPLIITKSQLPVINSEISKILHGIVDFSVEIENDEDTDSSEIYINYGDSRRIIELCSGMEKTISSLAIRVAMINVSSLPKSDLFIIDEGFGTLDDAAVESCNRLLVSLKRYFKTIIVITHVDGIKDSVDHILEITKNEKDAKVFYGDDS